MQEIQDMVSHRRSFWWGINFQLKIDVRKKGNV